MIKKKNKVFTAVLASAIVTCVSMVGAGNYLVNYAITRQSNSGDRKVENQLLKDQSDQLMKIVKENTEKEEIYGKQWHENTTFEEWNIKSFDGLKLYGEFYEAKEESHKYLLLIHGYKMDREAMYGYAAHYWDKGFNVLVIDQRSHGKSEGKYIGMGWLEKSDMKQWLQCLIDRDGDAQIALHGVSMGAATVMMTSGEDLPEQVKVCVEDCGYSSVWEILSSELKARYNLEEFPILYISSGISKLRAGYNFKEASSVNQLKKCKIPMLFIHGTKDGFVPFYMLQKVYDSHPGEKDMFVVEGVDHCDAVNADVDAYYEKVFSFIDQYITE